MKAMDDTTAENRDKMKNVFEICGVDTVLSCMFKNTNEFSCLCCYDSYLIFTKPTEKTEPCQFGTDFEWDVKCNSNLGLLVSTYLVELEITNSSAITKVLWKKCVPSVFWPWNMENIMEHHHHLHFYEFKKRTTK